MAIKIPVRDGRVVRAGDGIRTHDVSLGKPQNETAEKPDNSLISKHFMRCLMIRKASHSFARFRTGIGASQDGLYRFADATFAARLHAARGKGLTNEQGSGLATNSRRWKT